jgi:hypothetical protein
MTNKFKKYKPVNSVKMNDTSWYWFLAAGIIYLLQNKFFLEDTINSPDYLYLICLILGLFSGLIFVMRTYNLNFSKINFYQIKYIVTVILFVFSFSLLVFGIVNYLVSRNSEDFVIRPKITHISSGGSKSPMIYYYFQDELNIFSGAREIYKLNEFKTNYFVVTIKKGLFGSYIIEDYRFET